MPYNKGDIIKGAKTRHPIIYLEDRDQDTFRGLVITHSQTENYSDNIQLQKQHFENQDENGSPFEVVFDNSFVVGKYMIKRNDWGPYTKKGQLTEIGILYIEEKIAEEDSVYWNIYTQQTNAII